MASPIHTAVASARCCIAGGGPAGLMLGLLLARAGVDVIERYGRVVGVHAVTPEGPLQLLADLVIGADGRRSALRAAAGLKVREIGAPIDVLWMRLPKAPGDPPSSGGRVNTGRFLAMLNRASYWQCAYVI